MGSDGAAPGRTPAHCEGLARASVPPSILRRSHQAGLDLGHDRGSSEQRTSRTGESHSPACDRCSGSIRYRQWELAIGGRVLDGSSAALRQLSTAPYPRQPRGEADADRRSAVDLPLHGPHQGARRLSYSAKLNLSGGAARGRRVRRRRERWGKAASQTSERVRKRQGEGEGRCQVRPAPAWRPSLSFFAAPVARLAEPQRFCPVPPEPSGWRPHVRHHDHHVAPRFPVRGSCWAPTLGCASSGFSLPVPFYSPREPFCPGNPSSGLGPLPPSNSKGFLTSAASVQDPPSAGVEPPSSPESFPRRVPPGPCQSSPSACPCLSASAPDYRGSVAAGMLADNPGLPTPEGRGPRPTFSDVKDEPLPGSAFAAAPSEPSGPGARAPRVLPSELWSEFFSCLSRARCSLSAFFHSIRLLPRAERGPKCAGHSSRRRRVWPIPLPFPELLCPGSGGTRDPESLGLNAVVLVLDWVLFGQPAVVSAKLNLALGESLSPRQEEAVASLRLGVRASNAAGPLGPKDLGRATAKFEGLSDMLEACQAEWAALPSSGAPLSEALFSYAAPCPVLPVEPSRLTFVGKPSFDPEPYLDSQNRATYARPLDFAREVPGEEPIPRVAVRADRRQTGELLRLLDASGRLRLFRKNEVRPRLRNGLFSVGKDHARDRMVLDARPPNLAEVTEARWIRSLGTLEQFQFIYLPENCDFEIHTEDLEEFYHSFHCR